MRWLLCLVVGALWVADTSPAPAAQVGTAVVNGRIVILNDDNTWRFADAPDARTAAPCDRLTGVEICIKELGWTQAPKSGAFAAVYMYAGRYYFGVIQEPFGANAGVSPEALQTFLVGNAAQIANVKPEQVPIISASATVPRVSGARAIAFSLPMSGVQFVYYNVFKVRASDSVQLAFWSIGSALTPEFTAKIDETLAKIKVD